jgi:hypothetical protein
MGNKQTAVEWLMMQLPVFIRVDLYEKELYQQAKEKEKEQIMDAFDGGAYVGTYAVDMDSEEYYNETYGK